MALQVSSYPVRDPRVRAISNINRLPLHSQIFSFRPTRDIVLPFSDPVCLVGSPDPVHELLIPKGTEVMLGIATINRSKALWGENAHEWEPERWLRPLPASLVDAHLPGVYSSSFVQFKFLYFCLIGTELLSSLD